MIVVQDKIEIAGGRLERLQQLFHDGYVADAADRGLHFVDSLVSPPVILQDAPVTLWLRWQVADPGAWWAMRAQSGNSSVASFWAEVDSLCIARERIYLTADTAAKLPRAENVSRFAVGTQGYRETAQLVLRGDASDSDRAALESVLRSATGALPGLEAANLGANFAPEYAAGHYTWDLLYPDSKIATAARLSAAWQQEIKNALDSYCISCHALSLETIGAGLRRPDQANVLKRTAYFRVLPGTAPGRAQQFERDLLEMAAQIPAILNWRLSRAGTLPWDTAGCKPWTYVWEQEYESLDCLLGPYMAHPHHWAHIDRWFDQESGVQAVDSDLSHAFCLMNTSIISCESKPL